MSHKFKKGDVIKLLASTNSLVESFSVVVSELLVDQDGNPGYEIKTPRGTSFIVSEEKLQTLLYNRVWRPVEESDN